MRRRLALALCLIASAAATLAASPFVSAGAEPNLAMEASVWRFTSRLNPQSVGRIEVVYAESGAPERVLGAVPVYPFRSSDPKMPDLRVVVARDLETSVRRVVVIIGYGLRSGVFVTEAPGLTSHSLVSCGTPAPNERDELTLEGFGDFVSIRDNVLQGARGRVFVRYVPST